MSTIALPVLCTGKLKTNYLLQIHILTLVMRDPGQSGFYMHGCVAKHRLIHQFIGFTGKSHGFSERSTRNKLI